MLVNKPSTIGYIGIPIKRHRFVVVVVVVSVVVVAVVVAVAVVVNGLSFVSSVYP